jgi:CP family cyanate transporter-like MFS transporter
MQARPEHQETPAGKTLVIVGIIALAFNLRPAAVSVGPVLQEIIRDMHMSATVAGLLTAMPVIAFSSFGALAPGLARRMGAHRLTLAALLLVVLGLLVRAQTSSTPVFLALSFVGLSGMATANVLLPSLVRVHFPNRVGQMTAVYTTSMAIGLTAASVLTVPVADRVAGEGWRAGLGVWALTALLAVLPWLVLARSDAHTVSSAHAIRMRDIARTRLGWSMAAFFGLQSLQAYAIFGWFAQVYRDAGFSAEVAGLLLGLITAIGIPLSFWVPSRAARMSNQAPLLVGLIACYPLGYLGLMLAPAGRRAVGRGRRRRQRGLPARAHVDWPARAHQRRDRRALGLHAVGGLPSRHHRAARGGRALRPHRGLGAAARCAHRALLPPAARWAGRRASGQHRRPASSGTFARSHLTRLALTVLSRSFIPTLCQGRHDRPRKATF